MAGEWVVVDVETSGFRPSHDRVLSVAAVALDASGEVVDEVAELVNPGVDPGPVHVHGLTPARLAGRPRFVDVAPRLARALTGRTLVAHNAVFDLSFLVAEFDRAGLDSPVVDYLCTLELSGRLHLACPDLKLGTLAAHFGVEQRAAHDAHDDALVLAEVFAGLRWTAADKSVGFTPRPVSGLAPDPDTGMLVSRAWLAAVSAPRPWRHAGRLTRGSGLVRGMEAVFTADVDGDRDELATRLVGAGLYVADRISSRTSFAVCDAPGAVRGRAVFARRKGLELVTCERLDTLLTRVDPGRPATSEAVDDGQGAFF